MPAELDRTKKHPQTFKKRSSFAACVIAANVSSGMFTRMFLPKIRSGSSSVPSLHREFASIRLMRGQILGGAGWRDGKACSRKAALSSASPCRLRIAIGGNGG
jgi:hypothetical protein